MNNTAMDIAITALSRIRDESQELWVVRYAAQVASILNQRREFDALLARSTPQMTLEGLKREGQEL